MTSPGAPGYVPPPLSTWQVKRNRIAFPPAAPLILSGAGPQVPGLYAPDAGLLTLTGSEVSLTERPARVLRNTTNNVKSPDWDGSSFDPPDVTWTHTPTDDARRTAIIVAVFTDVNGDSWNTQATYGGAAMTLLGRSTAIGLIDDAPANIQVGFFGLLDAPGGAQTVRVFNVGTDYIYRTIDAMSVAYTNVGSFGSVYTQAGYLDTQVSTSLSMTVPSATGNKVVQAWTVRTGNTAITAYSQTRLANATSGASRSGTFRGVIGDAPGGDSVTFTATKKSNDRYAGIAVNLIPG